MSLLPNIEPTWNMAPTLDAPVVRRHVVVIPVPVHAGKRQPHKKAGGTVEGSSVKPRLDKRARGGKLPLHRRSGRVVGKLPQSAWLSLAGSGLGMANGNGNLGSNLANGMLTGARLGRLMRNRPGTVPAVPLLGDIDSGDDVRAEIVHSTTSPRFARSNVAVQPAVWLAEH